MKLFKSLLIALALATAIPHHTECVSPNPSEDLSTEVLKGLLHLGFVVVGTAISAWIFIKVSRWESYEGAPWKIHKKGTIKETFDAIAGNDNTKEELQDIVDYLCSPDKYTEIGAKIPKGVLMQGPPGTGKTSLARALAGKANCTFISVSGSEFINPYQGVGAARIKSLFNDARKNGPCIIFIDEIDALAQKRGTYGSGGKDMELTLNQFLTEMDGFHVNQKPIIVVGSTNRLDTLDPAVLRPGRFDRIVEVGLPDVAAREKILAVHARNVQMDSSANLALIAKSTPGFSGADLANLINEAAIGALKAERKTVEHRDLEEALDKLIMGKTTKGHLITTEEKRITAYHEAGHTLINILLSQYCAPLHKVTIIPRGGAGGFTAFLQKEEMFSSKDTMLANITMAFGGRAAEELIFNKILTGASNDIKQATAGARAMICTYGMSEKLGPVTYIDTIAAHLTFSPVTARLIDEEVQNILVSCHDRAYQLLSTHTQELTIIAQALLEKETLSAEEIYVLLAIKPDAQLSIA